MRVRSDGRCSTVVLEHSWASRVATHNHCQLAEEVEYQGELQNARLATTWPAVHAAIRLGVQKPRRRPHYGETAQGGQKGAWLMKSSMASTLTFQNASSVLSQAMPSMVPWNPCFPHRIKDVCVLVLTWKDPDSFPLQNAPRGRRFSGPAVQ